MKNIIRRTSCLLLAALMLMSMGTVAFAEVAAHEHNYVGGKCDFEGCTAHNHVFGEHVVTKEASCQRSGEKTLSCTVEGCSYTETETISAIGHIFGKDGICTLCGFSKVPAHSHAYTETVITAASCTADGEMKYSCTAEGECDRREYTDKILSKGHAYGEDGKCTVCGAVKPIDCTMLENCPAATHDPNCIVALALKAQQELEAEMERANQIAVEKVQALMNAIPDVPADFDGVSYPETLREPTEAYNALSPELQARVDTSRLMAWYAPVAPVADEPVYVAQIGETKKYETLAAAISAAQTDDVIKIVKDCTIKTTAGTDYALLINKPLTIEGVEIVDDNSSDVTYPTISYNDDDDDRRAFNIDTTGNVTFKNLSLNASEVARGINIINNPAIVSLENVSISAANYAVMIATSAAGAKLDIKGGVLSGKNTVNIGGTATVTITDTALCTDDASDAEDYSTIAIFQDAPQSSVTVSGCTFEYNGQHNGDGSHISDGSQGSSITDGGSNTVTGSDLLESFTVKKLIAAVGDAGYYDLIEAINDAQGGKTVKLLQDLTISTTNLGDAVLDLNGHELIGQVYGKVRTNGGYYAPSTAFPLISKNETTAFISNDASFDIVSDTQLNVTAGEISIGFSWRTPPGQTVNVSCDKLIIGSGKEFTIRGHVVVADKCTTDIEGNLILGSSATDTAYPQYTTQDYINATMGATLKVPAELPAGTVTSGISGFVVKYDSASKTYSLYAEAFIEGTDPNNSTKTLNTYYSTLAAAISAANEGATIHLLRDVETPGADLATKNLSLDLNGFKLTGGILGTMKINGGSYCTPDRNCLIGREADDPKFLSSSAVITVGNNSLSIANSDISVYHSWRTLPGQSITIESGSFTVPSDKTFEILGQAVINGTIVQDVSGENKGKLILGCQTSATSEYTDEQIKEASKGATLTAPAGLDVSSGIDGYMVKYENGVYSLSESIASIGNAGYSSLSAAIAAANATDTITLLGDVTISTALNVSGSKNIQANGHDFSVAEGGSITLADGAQITIQGLSNEAAKINELRAALPNLCVVQGSVIIKGHTAPTTSSCTPTVNCTVCGGSMTNPAISHVYTYTANDNVITEKCDNGCGHEATATLKIKSDAKLSYTGVALDNVLEADIESDWKGGTPVISYKNNTVVSTSDSPAVGYLTLDMPAPLSDVVASLNFTITAAKYDLEPWAKRYVKDSGASYSFDVVGLPYELFKNGNAITSLKITGPLTMSITIDSATQVKYSQNSKTGDLVIHLQPAIMKLLTRTGSYTISATFENATASGSFRVIHPLITPTTGDTANFLLWGGLLAGAAAALGGSFFLLKKFGKKEK